MNEKNKKESIAICLNCYKIKFHEKNKKNSKNVLDVFGTADLNVIVNRFIKMIDTKKVFQNKAQDRILYLKESLSADKVENTYIGVIMKGHNGPQTSIDELAGSQVKTVNTVSKDQFHCLPYLFLLHINKKKPNDILFIAQSYRQYGFKEVFEECFKTFTNLESLTTTVTFNALSIASLFEKQIKDGFINALRFVKHGLAKNVEFVAQGDEVPVEDYKMELKIKATKGFLGIKQHMKYDDASFIEQIKIDGFDYKDAYADVVIGNRKRVMNLTQPTEFSAAYDITEKVKINKNTKLPNFKDVEVQAIDILRNDLIPYL